MNKKMWTHSALALSLALFLSACGGDKKEEESEPQAKPKVEAPASDSTGKSGAFNLEQAIQQANSGNVQAQIQLGDYYGLRSQYKDSFEWFQKAAKQGNAVAQRSLAHLYNEGNGVDSNPVVAYSWYRKAALQNDAEAMLSLVDFFNEGDVVAKDALKAGELYKKAKTLLEEQVKKDDHQAQRNLGLLLVETGTPEDIKVGMEWLNKAAQTGDSQAEATLAWAYTKESAENKLPNAELALSWYEKAAQKDNMEALLALGNIYSLAEINQENLNKAIAVYIQASNLGSLDAQTELIKLYLDGDRFAKADFFKVDSQKALALLVKSAEQGNEISLDRLIEIYEKGLYGVPVSLEDAIKWQSVKQKNIENAINEAMEESKATSSEQTG